MTAPANSVPKTDLENSKAASVWRTKLRQVPTPIKEVFSGGGPPRACAAISATKIGGGADLAHLQRLLWTGQRLQGLQHPALLQACSAQACICA
jgi:hypothetical protein